MNVESCGCTVGYNASGRMLLTSAASIVTYFSAKNGQLCCRENELGRKFVMPSLPLILLEYVACRQMRKKGMQTYELPCAHKTAR